MYDAPLDFVVSVSTVSDLIRHRLLFYLVLIQKVGFWGIG